MVFSLLADEGSSVLFQPAPAVASFPTRGADFSARRDHRTLGPALLPVANGDVLAQMGRAAGHPRRARPVDRGGGGARLRRRPLRPRKAGRNVETAPGPLPRCPSEATNT